MLFDHLATFYGLFLKVFNVSKDEAVALLNLPTGAVVLDLGGGTGIGAASAVRTAAARGVVVDLSVRMLRQGASYSRLLRVQGDAHRLPLADASVDAVLCLDALHHFRQPLQALSEARRVLRPGGTILIEELDATRRAVRLVALIERVAGEPGRFWSPAEMPLLLQSAGFVASEVVNGGSIYYVLARRESEAVPIA